MDYLVAALERTIELLEKSEDSVWANYSVAEAQEILQSELENYRRTREISESGKYEINLLFLPTSALQEISIDNGWGDEYVKISGIIDEFL